MIRRAETELSSLHARYAPRKETPAAGATVRSESLRSDEEIIQRVKAERNGKFDRLYAGDLSDYAEDHSAADDAFVHKLWSYTQDPEQIRCIHASSDLHRPDKSGRRADYLERSIRRAEKNVSWFYEWPASVTVGSHRLHATNPDAQEPPASEEVGVMLSDVEPERVEWLWPGRIPLGKITVLDGNPGLGKSTAAIDFAARVSVGGVWPDGSECEAGGVVIINLEDGLADTTVPRFLSAGGDTSRAVALSTVMDSEGHERLISIPGDLHIIERAVERVEARYVVVDPLMALLASSVNSYRDQDMRGVLAPLAMLGEKTGAAIVLVRHLNKATGGAAIYRGGGSIGIIGAARSGLLIAEHPEDDTKRVMASIKNNLAAPAPSLVFSLASTESGVARVRWSGQSLLDANSLLSAPVDQEEKSKLTDARDFLLDILQDGPVAVSEIKSQANNADVGWRTIERVKASLGIEKERRGEPGKRGGGAWYWVLLSINPANAKGWRPKPEHDDADVTYSAYSSENQSDVLRPPTDHSFKSANMKDGLKNGHPEAERERFVL